MAYTRGTSDNIIVGAAAIFVADAPLAATAAVSATGLMTHTRRSTLVYLTRRHFRQTLTLITLDTQQMVWN